MLKEKLKSIKKEIKYNVMELLVLLALEKKSELEVLNIKKCVQKAVSFWIQPLYENLESIKDKYVKIEELVKINNFYEYLTTYILYDLVVKNLTYSFLNKIYKPHGILLECVIDSGINCEYLKKQSHMLVFKNKVELNSVKYYSINKDNVKSMKIS